MQTEIWHENKGKSPGCDDIPTELSQVRGEVSVRIYHALVSRSGIVMYGPVHG